MFNPEIKAKWVAALRSGEYTQCKAKLKYIDYMGNTSYCCLGVLAYIEPAIFVGQDTTSQLISDGSWRLMGGKVYDGNTIEEPLVQTTLSEMNDAGRSFAEIADFIEKHY